MSKKKNKTIDDRIVKNKKAILEQLKKLPIVQVACQRISVGRATYYRWRKDDEDFAKQSDEAIAEGIDIVNDLSESQLITMVKNQNFPAIRFWLQNRHKAYTNKIAVSEEVKSDNLSLTKEQKEIMKDALWLASPHTNDEEK